MRKLPIYWNDKTFGQRQNSFKAMPISICAHLWYFDYVGSDLLNQCNIINSNTKEIMI
jgi:hypothetical protein